MHLKDILFAIANFLILFGALFFITRKMISRMFRERKEKIAGAQLYFLENSLTASFVLWYSHAIERTIL